MFNFGENLKNLRISKGFTQEQVAGLLDISKQSVSRWENNITYPDITFLPILALDSIIKRFQKNLRFDWNRFKCYCLLEISLNFHIFSINGCNTVEIMIPEIP